jgi:hypothetical protein
MMLAVGMGVVGWVVLLVLGVVEILPVKAL